MNTTFSTKRQKLENNEIGTTEIRDILWIKDLRIKILCKLQLFERWNLFSAIQMQKHGIPEYKCVCRVCWKRGARKAYCDACLTPLCEKCKIDAEDFQKANFHLCYCTRCKFLHAHLLGFLNTFKKTVNIDFFSKDVAFYLIHGYLHMLRNFVDCGKDPIQFKGTESIEPNFQPPFFFYDYLIKHKNQMNPVSPQYNVPDQDQNQDLSLQILTSMSGSTSDPNPNLE